MIKVNYECLDYMNQLNTGKLINYNAGNLIDLIGATNTNTGVANDYMLQDTDYVYVTDTTTGVTRKYAKATSTLIATSPAYGGNVYAVAQDTTYFYMYGDTVKRVKQYLKADMTYVSQSAAYTQNALGTFHSDGTHVYLWDNTTLYKLTVANLAVVAASVNHGVTIGTVYRNSVLDAGYIFMQWWDGVYYRIKKVDTSTLQVALSGNYVMDTNNYIYCMDDDDDYIYFGGLGKSVTKMSKANLNVIAQSLDYGAYVKSISVDGNYVYVGSSETGKDITRYSKDRLTFSDNSNSSLLFDAPDLAVDGNYMYLITSTVLVESQIFMIVEDIIDDILSYDTQLPAITSGTVDGTYGNLYRTVKVSNKTLLQTILNMRNFLGGYVDVDNNRQLNWTTTIGEDKGQQIRYRKNLIGIERDIDYSKLYNRIYCYGRYSGGDIIRLSDIQPDDYVEDAASQGTWDGVFNGSFTDLSINTAEALLEWANTLLAEFKDPPISYRVKTLDLSVHSGFEFDKLQIGSTVTVIDEDLGIDVSVQVVRIEYPDLLNPQDMEIELSTTSQNIVDSIADMDSKQKLIEMIV